MKTIAEENDNSYVVSAMQKAKVIEIDWADVNLEDDAYVIRAEVVSSLPDQIPGKIDYIQQLEQLNILPPWQLTRLMQNPDIDAVINPQQASIDYIYKNLENILDYGEEGYTAPEKLDNLPAYLKISTDYYQKAKNEDAPAEVLKFLRLTIEQVGNLLAPPPAMPNGPQMPAEGQPMPQGGQAHNEAPMAAPQGENIH